MRRGEREVTDRAEMLEILESCDVCRLGLVDTAAASPEAYIVPMNFGIEVDGGRLTLWFHCASEGRKLDIIKRGGTVTFEADCRHELMTGNTACEWSYRYASVMGKGRLTIADGELKAYGLDRIMSHYGSAGMHAFNDRAMKAVTVLRLDVTDITCKRH